MTFVITSYIILLIVVAASAGINVFHVFRFRLKDPGDKSLIAVFIYLTTLIAIVALTLFTGIVAFNL